MNKIILNYRKGHRLKISRSIALSYLSLNSNAVFLLFFSEHLFSVWETHVCENMTLIAPFVVNWCLNSILRGDQKLWYNLHQSNTRNLLVACLVFTRSKMFFEYPSLFLSINLLLTFLILTDVFFISFFCVWPL